MVKLTVQQVAEAVNGELVGNSTNMITGPEQIDKANENQVTFIGSRKFIKKWADSSAGAVVVDKGFNVEPLENRAVIRVNNADLAMAKLLEVFSPPMPVLEHDIHPTAVVHETAQIGQGCKIGANCYIGKDVVLGNGVTLYPNVTILDETTVGDGTLFWSGVVVRERCIIGMGCIFQINCSIGADGFGYRPAEDGRGLVKVPQIGNVVIGHGVEVGANSSIDRAKFSSTILGDGCKIDNQVQIGHNSVLGRACIMAGASGLAGSVTLGDGVIIGGSASIKDHTTIHSGATVGAGSGVMNDVPAGTTVLGYPAREAREMLKQWVAQRKLVK